MVSTAAKMALANNLVPLRCTAWLLAIQASVIMMCTLKILLKYRTGAVRTERSSP